jgi:hypothetical protein
MILLHFSKSKIPIDPFWAAAMLATFRALSAIIGSSVNGKCKRRPLYLICCGVSIFGQLSLSSFCYFDQDELLTTNFPFTRWIPIFSIMIIYTAFSFGFGGIPWMLQVIFFCLNNQSSSKNLVRCFLGSAVLGIRGNSTIGGIALIEE